ncbi:MAG: alpha/beta hydrolase [Flavisolibacter sp.]|jgi:acetyl esterase/lipase|nr:alpha/beta hydrolase [Flavisolibacter sp.]
MARLILVTILFLLSLLTVFRAPTSLLWYVSILVTEFCWIFFMLICLLLFSKFGSDKYNLATTIIGIAGIILFLLPLLQAFRISQKLGKDFSAVFKAAPSAEAPFNLLKMLTGINAKKVNYKTITYDPIHQLSLDFYHGVLPGKKPCVVVIHGGSWAGGDSRQLPELNSELAKSGYHVASINYRLAPGHIYPSTTEDVQGALRFLRSNAATFSIDTNNFILLGRSAGGQIALSAGYLLNDPGIKGVICFYGPSDMVWGYQNPTSPLVLDSRKIMEDYLGGTLSQQDAKYINSSATETVTADTPPTLLIYGENDPLVSPRHGTRLSIKLKEQHIKFFELYLPWATHGFDYTLNGPGGQLSTWTVKRFLEATLNGNN